ncbi:MAG: RNA methyltransferase [Verrucomicrobiota bacterium]
MILHIPITDLALPELQPYRTLRRQEDHYQKRIFVAEGEKTLRRLLATSYVIVSVLLTREWLEVFESLLKNRAEEIPVYVAEKPLLETLTGFTMFQGVMAVAKIPEGPSLKEMVEDSRRPKLFVATDGVGNAENLGTLVRNCAAFSVDALFISRSSSSPFLRRAVRSSMGGIFKIPVLEELNLVDTFQELRAGRIRCIGANPNAGEKTLPELDLSGDCCLVFGNEANGISEEVLAACDELAAIPMPLNVDSMNVSSAGAVFLYEVWRQRRSGRASVC